MPRRRIIAATCLVAVACLACPSDGGGTVAPKPTTSPTTAPPAPQRGKIALGVMGEPATFDPYSPLASDLTHWLARPIYPSLFRVAPDGSVIPDLAKDLRTSEAGVVIELRRSRWSNGDWVTAQDVKASIERARPPSGFARLGIARVRGRFEIELIGDDPEWRRTLATYAPILPGGMWRPHGATMGPFVRAGHVPGLRLVYRSAPSSVPRPALRRVEVTFTQSLEMMLALLDRGRLDAAVLPMSVNLDDRLDERGLEHAEGPFGETIYMDLDGAAPDTEQRARMVAAVDTDALLEGFIRDDGSSVVRMDAFKALDGPDLHVQLAAPAGDELLTLMQRAMQLHLKRAGITAELVTIDPKTFYGRWALDDPSEIALRRTTFPVHRRADLDTVPLFRVETVIAWRPGVEGPAPTASPDGPLWNLETWFLSE